MAFTNSPLVEFTRISPNKTSPRNHSIDTLVIHTMAGNLSVESCGSIFSSPERKASSNYGIDSKGRIAMYCEEKDRSWCTSSAAVDNRGVTIEVASLTNKEPYECSDAAMKSLIKLCADICKRNGIKKLLWKADKSLIGQVDKQNMDVHRYHAKKSCLPIDTEILTENGWKYLATIQIGDKVASVNKEDLALTFSPVLDIVPIRKEEVIKVLGVEVTRDHNMLFCNGHKEFRNTEAANLLIKENFSIPTAGYYKAPGLDITEKELDMITLILTRGSRILNQNSGFIGIRFKTPKYENKILSAIKDFTENKDFEEHEDCIDVYDSKMIKFYSEYIAGDNLWKLINLSKTQLYYLFYKLYQYSEKLSEKVKGLMIALAAINGAGVTKSEDGNSFLSEPILRKGENRSEGRLTDVSCVTVETGYILIKQNGNTFVVGNCPGEYLYNKHFYIADEVNKILGTYDEKDKVPSTTPKGGTTINAIPIKTSASSNNDKVIWDFLKDKGLNDFAIAGVMGNLFAESGLIPTNLQNNFEKKLKYTDESYTKAVDDGSYSNFIKDAAGYGLAQWTYWTRKKALLEFAKANKASIGDLKMQLNFLWQEFNNNGRLLTLLKSATSVRMASDFMLKIFERPADMSESVQEKRASYGMKYYNKFAKVEIPKEEKIEEKKEVIPPKVEEIKKPIVSDDIKITIPTEKVIKKPSTSNKFVEMLVKLIIEFFKALFKQKPVIRKPTIVDAVLTKKNPVEDIGNLAYSRPEYAPEPPKAPVFERPADLAPAPSPIKIPKAEEVKMEEVKKGETFESYKVKIVRSVNYRSGPGTKYKILGLLKPGEVYTISGEKMNGPTKWGKLQSGAGWVSLSFTKRI